MVCIVITDMITHYRRSLVVRYIIVRCVDVMLVSESRRTLADGGRFELINVTAGTTERCAMHIDE
jgi:hypothetical protein